MNLYIFFRKTLRFLILFLSHLFFYNFIKVDFQKQRYSESYVGFEGQSWFLFIKTTISCLLIYKRWRKERKNNDNIKFLSFLDVWKSDSHYFWEQISCYVLPNLRYNITHFDLKNNTSCFIFIRYSVIVGVR